MKLGVCSVTGVNSDLHINVVPLVVGMKIEQFIEIIVKTSNDNHGVLLDASPL